jgi:hypothetical protein
MRKMKRKRILLIPFAAMAVTAIFAAGAFACTIFRGTLSMQGNASSATVKTTGNGTGMVQTVSSSIAKASKTGGSIKLWAGADAYGRKLPAKGYQVRYYNGKGYSDHTHWVTDCMAGGPGVTLGSATVTTQGKFSGQPIGFNLPASTANTSPQESAVCVSDSFADYGNMAPLTIL